MLLAPGNQSHLDGEPKERGGHAVIYGLRLLDPRQLSLLLHPVPVLVALSAAVGLKKRPSVKKR